MGGGCRLVQFSVMSDKAAAVCSVLRSPAVSSLSGPTTQFQSFSQGFKLSYLLLRNNDLSAA